MKREKNQVKKMAPKLNQTKIKQIEMKYISPKFQKTIQKIKKIMCKNNKTPENVKIGTKLPFFKSPKHLIHFLKDAKKCNRNVHFEKTPGKFLWSKWQKLRLTNLSFFFF